MVHSVGSAPQALSQRTKLVKTLLSERRLPARGWDEDTIEMFVKVCP